MRECEGMIKGVFVVAALAVSVAAFGISLKPGESDSVSVQVLAPTIPTTLDVLFLVDATGSIASVIDSIEENAAMIVDTIRGMTSSTTQFGLAYYKDYVDPDLFVVLKRIDENDTSIGEAFGIIEATNGGDWPESGLFALQRLADTDVAGWREGSTKLIVWFGNSPSHARLCPAASLLFVEDATETTAIAALKLAGVQVIAINIADGVSAGLDDTPDVLPACLCGTESGCNLVAGQATRIASSTGGIVVTGVSNETVVETIIDSVDTVPALISGRCSCFGTQFLSCNVSPSSPVTVNGGATTAFTMVVALDEDESSCIQDARCVFEAATNGIAFQTSVVHVEIIDTIPPWFTSQQPTSLSVARADQVPVPPLMSAEDNCGGVLVMFSERRTDISACSFVLTRTWEAMDNSENSANFVQTITVSGELKIRDEPRPTVCLWPPNHKHFVLEDVLLGASSPFSILNATNARSSVRLVGAICQPVSRWFPWTPFSPGYCEYHEETDTLVVRVERPGFWRRGSEWELVARVVDTSQSTVCSTINNGVQVKTRILIPHDFSPLSTEMCDIVFHGNA